MKPFNLEKFIAGEPAVTRDGRKVIDWHYFKDAKNYQISFMIEGDADVFSATGEGVFYLDKYNKQSEYDLFMEEKEVELWVNVYDARNGQYNAYVHKTELNAKERKTSTYPFKGTHKITIKE